MSYVLAIDIGGTKVASALVDLANGTIIGYDTDITDKRGGEYAVKQLANIIEEKRTLFRNSDIIGIGISIPGIVKDFNEVVWAPNIPLWSNIRLCDELKKLTSFQGNILLLDDRIATALGEVWQGEAKGFRDAITLIIGTGVGAGIILNGKPIIGSTGAVGAIGWWLLSKTLPQKKTTKGFLEESMSGPAIVKKTEKLCKEETFKIDCEKLKKLCNDIIDTRCIFRAYDEGIGVAISVLQKVVTIAGITIANIVSMINPEIIILSGSVGIEIGKKFLKYIEAIVKQIAQPYAKQNVILTYSKLGHKASLYGVAHLFTENIRI